MDDVLGRVSLWFGLLVHSANMCKTQQGPDRTAGLWKGILTLKTLFMQLNMY